MGILKNKKSIKGIYFSYNCLKNLKLENRIINMYIMFMLSIKILETHHILHYLL